MSRCDAIDLDLQFKEFFPGKRMLTGGESHMDHIRCRNVAGFPVILPHFFRLGVVIVDDESKVIRRQPGARKRYRGFGKNRRLREQLRCQQDKKELSVQIFQVYSKSKSQ